MKKALLFAVLVSLFFMNCSSPASNETGNSRPDSATVKTIRDAFLFAIPLVLMDITRKKLTNYEVPADGIGAPINQFSISTKFPDADFKDVVRPNADTYYNTAMLDLSAEPMVLNLPNTHGRYYLMPMLSGWTDVFASPGKRTTGTEAGNYLITGPSWHGEVPAGLKKIKAPTDLVWILGRIQVNSAADGRDVVIPIEKKVILTPLSQYGKAYQAPHGTIDASLTKANPNTQLEEMAIDSFFNYANALMVQNPPKAGDSAAISAFASFNIGPGKTFSLSAFDTATQTALKAIPKQVVSSILAGIDKGLKAPVNGWSIAFQNFGDYKNDYLLRAVVAFVGLGANLAQDAIYPTCAVDANGNLFDGANKYVLHFDKGKTPPVNAFWSMSMYDRDGFFTHNPINRYAIGDRSNLRANADGSVDIYIQNDSPGKAKESNWLPAPKGSFNLLLRLYWPKEDVLNESWTPPAVKKVS